MLIGEKLIWSILFIIFFSWKIVLFQHDGSPIMRLFDMG